MAVGGSGVVEDVIRGEQLVMRDFVAGAVVAGKSELQEKAGEATAGDEKAWM